jgi:predicted nucleotidyltransferase
MRKAVHMGKDIYSINEISKIVTPIAKEYGIRKLAIFGSYAQGKATKRSDIDFLILDRGSLRGLIRLAGFQLALEDRFDVPIDILTPDVLSDNFINSIGPEEIIVYEQQ